MTLEQEEGFFGTLTGVTEALQKVLDKVKGESLPDFSRTDSTRRFILGKDSEDYCVM
jgi:hypothetical protein